MKKDWINITGNPIDGTSIKQTCVGGYIVSTIKLGQLSNSLDDIINKLSGLLNDGHMENPENKAYETKVFRSQKHKDGSYHIHDDFEEIEVQYYDTLEDTEKGHIAMCEKYDKETV